VITILGDLIPKTVGAVQNQRIAGFMAYPLFFVDRLLAPAHWLVSLLVTPVVRALTGGKSELAEVPTREEMRVALTLAHAAGTLHSVDVAVAQEALHFSTIDLRDIMTPRVDMTAVDETCTVAEGLKIMKETGYSRLPVYRDSPDQIIGVVLVKDLVRELDALFGGRLDVEHWGSSLVVDYLREVAFFPETKSVVDALGEIRKERSHLAVCVDEHGGTAGIVTLEDMIEELIGDIRDESDPDQSSDIIKRGDGYIIISGRARLDVLAELSGSAIDELGLSEIDATTVGGLLMERLGRPALVGDEITVGPLTISALRVLRNRIKLMRVELQQQEAGSEQRPAAG
jgi:putative hemolysin